MEYFTLTNISILQRARARDRRSVIIFAQINVYRTFFCKMTLLSKRRFFIACMRQIHIARDTEILVAAQGREQRFSPCFVSFDPRSEARTRMRGRRRIYRGIHYTSLVSPVFLRHFLTRVDVDRLDVSHVVAFSALLHQIESFSQLRLPPAPLSGFVL